MENVDYQVELLATDISILISEIKEIDGFISLCDDELIKQEYIRYKNDLIQKCELTNKSLCGTLKQYFDSKPNPVKLHYKILYRTLSG